MPPKIESVNEISRETRNLMLTADDAAFALELLAPLSIAAKDAARMVLLQNRLQALVDGRTACGIPVAFPGGPQISALEPTKKPAKKKGKKVRKAKAKPKKKPKKKASKGKKKRR